MSTQKLTFISILSSLLLACALVEQVSMLLTTPTPESTATLPPAVTRSPTPTSRPSSTPTVPPSPTRTRTPTPGPTRTPTATPLPTEVPTATPASSSEYMAAGMLARRNGDYGRASAAFQGALNLKPPAEQARQAQFRLGEAYWLSGDGDQALTALTTYLQLYPAGENVPEVHNFLADIYRSRKDYGNALAHLTAFKGLTQTLAAETDAAIADVMAGTGDSANAIAQYDRALQDQTLSAATRISILMRAGAAHLGRGEPARAAARYDAALALPSDAFTRAALNVSAGQAYAAANQMDLAQARWNTALTSTPDQPGAIQALTEMTNRNLAVDNLQRGIVNYKADNYPAAISALQAYAAGGGPRPGEARYFLGRSYAAQGAYAQAIAEYDVIINLLPQDPRAPDAYMEKADAQAAVGKIDDAVKLYKRLVEVLPDSTRADEALLQAGQLLEKSQRYPEAAAIFDQLAAQYASRDSAAEALFYAGLDHYRLHDIEGAEQRWQALVQRYPKSTYYTGGLYWQGKIAMMRGQTDAAKSLWKQAAAFSREVFKPFRRTFYAVRAREAVEPEPASDPRRLYDLTRYSMEDAAARAELNQWLTGWVKGPAFTPGELDAALRRDWHFRRGEEYLRLDRAADARDEFSALVDAHENDAPALYALALYFKEKGVYSLSVYCADRVALIAQVSSAPPAPRGLMLLRFPTYYPDLVVGESRANRINPLLYYGVLRLESHFDPTVTGTMGERGLAQIGMHVAPSIAKALNVQNFDPSQLYLPYVNIRFGNWLFAENVKKLDDPIYGLAAYNAGLGAALGWQDPDIDLAVESFDIENARLYVHIVYPYWQQYEELYR